jgi:hypothetical protein
MDLRIPDQDPQHCTKQQSRKFSKSQETKENYNTENRQKGNFFSRVSKSKGDLIHRQALPFYTIAVFYSNALNFQKLIIEFRAFFMWKRWRPVLYEVIDPLIGVSKVHDREKRFFYSYYLLP